MKQKKISSWHLAVSNQYSAFSIQQLLVKLFVFVLTFNFFIFKSFAQVGINATGAAPNASSMLDVSATDKGLLIPRIATSNRPASPVEGLLIYNTTTKCFEAYNSTTSTWVAFGCIGCQLPGAFSASAATSVTETSFSANWTASSGATTYFIDVATDAGFTSFVSGYNNLPVSNVVTYSVSGGITCGNTYYYRVRANNACGTSANSNAITQTTSACCIGGPPISGCGGLANMTDYRDNKVYKIVEIGTGVGIQCWMAENLNYSTSGSYTPIHSGAQLAGEKYCQNLGKVDDPTCPMGGLYEWANMMNGSLSCNGGCATKPSCITPVKGLCPNGWHVPSLFEWILLARNICTSGTCATDFPYDLTTGWRGTTEGGKMKVTPICGTLPCWNTPNTGATNSIGFAALPGGYSIPGMFLDVTYTFWMSSTKPDYNLLTFGLSFDKAQVSPSVCSETLGISVRCVKN